MKPPQRKYMVNFIHVCHITHFEQFLKPIKNLDLKKKWLVECGSVCLVSNQSQPSFGPVPVQPLTSPQKLDSTTLETRLEDYADVTPGLESDPVRRTHRVIWTVLYSNRPEYLPRIWYTVNYDAQPY
jgi:hypothetical protein